MLTFEQLPQAVSGIYDKLESIEKLILEKTSPTQVEQDHPMTIKNAAEFLQLSIPTIYGYVSKSSIPCMKKGKYLYFSKHELIEWIKSGKKKTIAETDREADQFLKRRGLK